jgi:hypothetical protein
MINTRPTGSVRRQGGQMTVPDAAKDLTKKRDVVSERGEKGKFIFVLSEKSKLSKS